MLSKDRVTQITRPPRFRKSGTKRQRSLPVIHRSRNDMLVTINDSLQNSSRCSCEEDLQTWSIRITASSEFARCAAMTITSSIRGARTCRSKPHQNQLQTSHSCRQCKLWCCQRSGHNCTCHSTLSYVEDCSSLLGEKFRATVRSCERSA